MNLFQLQANWRRVVGSAMFYGAAATAIRVGANLVLLPILLTRLSTSELALWWVFVALGGFANLADFGFGSTIARVYSFLWAGAEDFEAEGLGSPAKRGEPNLPRIRRLTSTVQRFYWVLGVAATLAIGLIGTLVLLKPAGLVTNPRAVWIPWGIYVLSIGYTLATSSWPLACQGLGKVRELQVSYSLAGAVYVLGAGTLLLLHCGLVAVVAATFLKGLIMREYCRRTYRKAVPLGAEEDGKADVNILKKLWPNASKLGILSIGAFLLSNGSVLISSHFLGDRITASFGLTAQIGAFLMSFAGLWLTVKWPELAMLRVQGRLEEMATLFARRLGFTMLTFLGLCTVVVLIGNRILAWKGTHAQLLPAPALIFYFAYLAQQVFYVQFGSLTYTENVVPFFRIGIFTGLAMLVLSYVMTRTFGFWGMLIAPLIAESICSNWYTVWRGFRGQPLRVGQMLQAALGEGIWIS